MDYGLDDKVVVISGAGRGIGLATAEAFAAEGAMVVAADLDPSAVGRIDARRRPLGRVIDVTVAASVEEFVREVIAQYGRIDVLVNNVGVAPFRDGGFLDTDLGQWQHTLDINFLSMVRMCRSVLPHMVQAGAGAIVSLASDAGRQPDPFFVDYAVSKSAVLSLSKSLSIEFGPKGIRSNCVSPGPTLTPAMDDFIDSLAARLSLSHDDALTHFAVEMRGLPLGRLNQPAEVAAVVVFLASAAAGQVTGAAYTVDAGSHRYV